MAEDIVDEGLRNRIRSLEQLNSFICARADCREKELRSFLVPRPVISEPEQGSSQSHSSNSVAPIQSTVPAVRPVPTLVSGVTKHVDGLLGPIQSSSTSGNTGILPISSSRSDGRRSCVDSHAPLSELDDSALFSRIPVDHSLNLVLSRLRRAQLGCNALVTSNQTDLQSFTFTQNSQNGKRIMMRIRVLEQENEELAKMNRSGRTARLRTEIALRRRFVQDMKQSFSDMEYLVEETENETEMLGNTLLMLQQRLQLAKITARILANELDSLEPGKAEKIFQQSNWSPYDPADVETTPADAQILLESEADDISRQEVKPEAGQSSVSSSDVCPTSSQETTDNDLVDRKRHGHHSRQPLKRNILPTPDPLDTPKSSEEEGSDRKRTCTEKDNLYGSKTRRNSRPNIPIDGPQRTSFNTDVDFHSTVQVHNSSTEHVLSNTVDNCVPVNKTQKPSFIGDANSSAGTPSNGQLVDAIKAE